MVTDGNYEEGWGLAGVAHRRLTVAELRVGLEKFRDGDEIGVYEGEDFGIQIWRGGEMIDFISTVVPREVTNAKLAKD